MIHNIKMRVIESGNKTKKSDQECFVPLNSGYS